jgi:hypothetical protein
MIDPEYGADQWDVLRIGNMRSPGVCKITGPGLVYGWDKQNANATVGAVTKPTNEPLKEFTVEIELSNEVNEYGLSDYDEWDAFQAYLEAMVANKAKRFARDVYHPDLARLHITAATLESISPMVTDGKGGGKITVKFIEHRPPKPLKTIPSTKTEGDKKIDQATKDLEALQNEWKTLGSNPTPTSMGDSL